MRRRSLCIMLLAAMGFAPPGMLRPAAAQSEQQFGTEDMVEAVRRLSESERGRSLAEIGHAEHDGMEFVEPTYDTSMRPQRALAMLWYERRHIQLIQECIATNTLRIAPTPPQDPYHEIPSSIDDVSMLRQSARLLDYDTMWCWYDRDFDGALRSVKAMLQLGSALTDSRDDVAILTGYAINALASSRIEKMADAAEELEPRPALSPESLGRLLDTFDANPPSDPVGQARLMALVLNRRVGWMRDHFKGPDGPARFATYLEHYGRTDEEARIEQDRIDEGAVRLHALFISPRVKELLPDDKDGLNAAADAHWETLTDEQRATARSQWAQINEISSPLIMPTIHLGDPAQSPTPAMIERQLERIEAIAASMTGAADSEAVRAAFVRLADEVESDRSQLTRIAAGPLAVETHIDIWSKSVERHAKTRNALDRLRAFVEPEADR